MRNRLLIKLMTVNLTVIGFVALAVWLTTDYLAADYLMTLMQKYNISPEPVHAMFVGALYRYLLGACAAAGALAVLLSFLFTRRVLGPLTRMTRMTRDIAAGNYAVSIPVAVHDEVGQLAAAFNRMTRSLRRLEQLRKQMMLDVAHELRTPLTNIQGYLEALTDGVLPPTRQTYTLLHEETMRLVRLVEDMLQLARADVAGSHLTLQPVDLTELITQVHANVRPEFDKKGLKVAWRPGQPVPVRADRPKLVQVLTNLFQNALQHAPDKGQLEIAVQPAGAFFKTVFANEGPEIDASDLPYLFERFYRGEKSRSREHGGAGIGLAIVKELVEAHGGTVGADFKDGRIQIWFALPREAGHT